MARHTKEEVQRRNSADLADALPSIGPADDGFSSDLSRAIPRVEGPAKAAGASRGKHSGNLPNAPAASAIPEISPAAPAAPTVSAAPAASVRPLGGRSAGRHSGNLPTTSPAVNPVSANPAQPTVNPINPATVGSTLPASGFKPAYAPGSGTRKAAQRPQPRKRKKAAAAEKANDFSRNSQVYMPAKKHTARNVIVSVLVVLALVLVGSGVAMAMYANSIQKEISVDNKQEAEAIDQVLTPTVSTEPFYMMVIGSDTRNDDEGQRSDTNIVARIDPGTATITLISIPRDTAINYGQYGKQKFNAAYNYDGAKGAITAASNLLGVPISHYVEIDFAGLVDLIDQVGGVTVDVPMRIEDADAGGTLEAGVQTLNGEEALIFARSRSYDTGDFQRSTNQRILVQAFVDKVLSLSPSQLQGVISSAAKSITTDMALTDILGYAQTFQNADSITMYSCLVPSDVAEEGGVSYVVCDKTALKEMMAVVDAGGDPSTVLTNDYTVSSSKEAEEQGLSGIPILAETDLVDAGLADPITGEVWGHLDENGNPVYD